MGNDNQSSIARNRQQLAVLENCLATLRQMTIDLTQHDLLGLERSLEQEAHLVSQLAGLQRRSSEDEKANGIELRFESATENSERRQDFETQGLLLLESLKQVAREIQGASRLNSTLIDNGFQLSNILLSAIYPPYTYRPLTSPQPLIGVEVPVQPRISIQS